MCWRQMGKERGWKSRVTLRFGPEKTRKLRLGKIRHRHKVYF